MAKKRTVLARTPAVTLTHRVLSHRDAAALIAGLLDDAVPSKRLAKAARDYLLRVDRAIRSVDRTLAAVARSEKRIARMESAGREGRKKAPVRHADLDHLAGTMTKKEAAAFEALIAEQRSGSRSR